jgi:hypothetical protein
MQMILISVSVEESIELGMVAACLPVVTALRQETEAGSQV